MVTIHCARLQWTEVCMKYSNYFKELVNLVLSNNLTKSKKYDSVYEISFQQLSDKDKRALVSAYLKEIEEAWDWLFSGDQSYELNSIFADYLAEPTPIKHAQFMRASIKACIEHHADKLQEVLDEFLDEHEYNYKIDSGYKQRQDKNSGEWLWTTTA